MPRHFDEPNMSDSTLLMSVEDLINMALGPPDVNKVDFKIIQTILHILARQQRMLQQRVEIRITEQRTASPPTRPAQKPTKMKEFSESSSSKSPTRSPPTKKRMADIKEHREEKIKEKHDKGDKAKAKAEKDAQKERERELRAQEKADKSARKEKEKAEKAEQKELEKAEKSARKEKEKAEKADQKEQEKADRSARREKEKAEKAEQKELEKADRSARKERERAEKEEQKEFERADRSARKEKEKEEQKELERADRSARKEKEKAEKAEQKELEKADKSSRKERERTEKEEQKELEKAEKSARKERERAEKEEQKVLEKAEKSARKERERAEKEEQKELEKAEKSARKEKERAEREEQKELERAQKEKEKAERAAAKERERAERDRTPSPATKGKEKIKVKEESTSSISITEIDRDKRKVLVVEKGPTTRSDSRARGASIDVVTQSQFALLEAAVKGLMAKAAPMGELRLPDNKKLRSDLVKGSASLTDTMEAMQVNARVKAAEEAIDRMAGLLTQLTAAGALPPGMDGQVEEARREAERALTSDTDDTMPIRARPSTARKSVAIDPMVKESQLARPSTARPSTVSVKGSISTVMGRASVVSQPSSTVTTAPEPGVTRGEMEDLIKSVKDDLWKRMNSMTNKATNAAESAMHTAKSVAEKLEVALKLDHRISSLYSLVADYAEQLSGFDAGLTTQMQSFQEQIGQIRNDLKGGLTQLEAVNNNAETAAVLELTERHEELVGELERTVHAHRALTAFQSQLADELRSLVECVEMLREQKADRDEVIDGLRDKADTSRLAGLLAEAEFARARAELARRLDVCHDKFHRQDAVWMGAIKDLLKTTDLKAEIIDLLSMKDDTQWQLQALQDRLKVLAAALGEPKAALLTRRLAAGAACGACGAAALMAARDAAAGAPPRLPALRPPPPEPCAPPAALGPEPDDQSRHICQRWVGGSHTLLSERTARERAPPFDTGAPPTKRYVGYGMDGRLYMMEEELQPCLECNEILAKEGMERLPPVGEDGAGDQGTRQSITTHDIK
ncbi:uncharacterized protein [Epargyreus clarus]|uniref:uncharacterized protein n=1 Tax=Epargyreus clarus TaxID=520877 RepID=UPI003C2CB463